MYKKIVLVLTVFALVMIISSCGALLGNSIEERVQQFEIDLNGSRSSIIENFSSDCGNYNAMNIATYWSDNTSVFDDDYKTFNIVIPSDPAETFTTTYSDNAGGPYNIKFYLVNEGDFFSGDNWKIRTIWVDDSVQIN
ncbi:MAG: hypothetical protein PF693_19155 [Spirochaetia bacterium]|jgi:protein involved in sex pheromone biosynthesis|nr:hypothetical protein [Spirochaetia bacterium]